MTTSFSLGKLKGLFKKKQRKMGPNPQRDWVVVFTIGCLVAVGFTTWSLLLYTKIQSGSLFENTGDSQVKTAKLNTAALTTITERFLKAKEGVPEIAVPDPSK